MNEKTVHEDVVMSYFSSGIWEYIRDYFRSLSNGGIYKPEISYEIPNSDYISAHWEDFHLDVLNEKPVYEYSDELKEVAKQYLPVFFKEYPEWQEAECLKIEV